jgi:hypothetical protein
LVRRVPIKLWHLKQQRIIPQLQLLVRKEAVLGELLVAKRLLLQKLQVKRK